MIEKKKGDTPNWKNIKAKHLHNSSVESLPELSEFKQYEDGNHFLAKLDSFRIASEPDINQTKGLRRQMSIQRYLKVRELEEAKMMAHSRKIRNVSEFGSLGSLSSIFSPFSEQFDYDGNLDSNMMFKPIRNPLVRGGSMPTIKHLVPIIKPIPYYVVSLTIDENPSHIIQESTNDLRLNGFSVTLEELEEMYQVWIKCQIRGKAVKTFCTLLHVLMTNMHMLSI